MPRVPRQAGDAAKALPAITNAGFFSDYYLEHRLDSGLADLYDTWTALEREGHPTARQRMRALGSAFDRHRIDAAVTAPSQEELDEGRLDLGLLPPDGVAALTQLNDALLSAEG